MTQPEPPKALTTEEWAEADSTTHLENQDKAADWSCYYKSQEMRHYRSAVKRKARKVKKRAITDRLENRGVCLMRACSKTYCAQNNILAAEPTHFKRLCDDLWGLMHFMGYSAIDFPSVLHLLATFSAPGVIDAYERATAFGKEKAELRIRKLMAKRSMANRTRREIWGDVIPEIPGRYMPKIHVRVLENRVSKTGKDNNRMVYKELLDSTIILNAPTGLFRFFKHLTPNESAIRKNPSLFKKPRRGWNNVSSKLSNDT